MEKVALAKRKNAKSVKKGATKKGRRGVNRGGRPSALSLLPIADLEAALAAKNRQLSALRAERTQVVGRLAAIDREIARLAGVRTGKPGRKPGPAPKAKAKAVKGGRRAARGPRAGNTLGNKLHEILSAAGKPMRLLDVLEAVRKSDYPTKSKYLRSQVSQTLSRDKRFRKVRRGVYRTA
ncbi:MAG: hypothetical protein BIFFINMI_01656 [Phycisphaerae bacterium]|nr:hypothetical protein [Phycisphaerae bacterium]